MEYIESLFISSRSLQRTLNDLKDYQKKHDFWQQQNDKLLAEQVPVEVKLAQHVSYEESKIKELSTEIGMCTTVVLFLDRCFFNPFPNNKF